MDDFKVEYLEHREVGVIDVRGNPARIMRVIVKIGPFGPYTLEWPKDAYTPALLAQAIEAKRMELRTLPT